MNSDVLRPIEVDDWVNIEEFDINKLFESLTPCWVQFLQLYESFPTLSALDVALAVQRELCQSDNLNSDGVAETSPAEIWTIAEDYLMQNEHYDLARLVIRSRALRELAE